MKRAARELLLERLAEAWLKYSTAIRLKDDRAMIQLKYVEQPRTRGRKL
jgi:hypothetical protein